MKVIDLLNKIANGDEMPKNIKYDNIKYFWCKSCKIYERLEDDSKNLYNDIDNLLDGIEIIEESKKIENISLEELHQCDCDYDRICLILDKLDEIIDYINSKGD